MDIVKDIKMRCGYNMNQLADLTSGYNMPI